MGIQFVSPSIRLHPRDNIIIAREEIAAGTSIDAEGISVVETIPAGHKLATRPIEAGEAVLKQGNIVGFAACDIAAGSLVHTHNVGIELSEWMGRAPLRTDNGAICPDVGAAEFDGFLRDDGRVGTRNFIGVFVVGNCGATVARQTADWFDSAALADYPNVDGVIPFTHEMGCGMEMTGEPMNLLRRTISGFIRNPNIAGAVVVALGCERNNLGGFLEQEKLAVGDRLKTVTIQDVGGIRAAFEIARKYVGDMLPAANLARRQTVSAKHLTIALQSSTQDGFSGLTANPVLGLAMDMVVRAGGTVIFSETPELLWAETQLASRAATHDVATKLQVRLDWWREHSKGRDTEISGRLNRRVEAAGVSTPLEKSVDSLSKAGTSPINGAYEYAYPVNNKGLVFMDTPDFDAIAVTGQIAGGATLVVMTTGTGTPFGSLPAPTLKLASNSETFSRAVSDTDIDCGPALSGEAYRDELARHTFEAILVAASGKKTKSEAEGMGENEFVPWSIGVMA